MSLPRQSILCALLLAACTREVAKYPVPSSAGTLPTGEKYVIVRQGDGPIAQTGGIWDVQWKVVSHSEPGCSYPCTSAMLRPVSDPHYAPDRIWMSTMREREIRRIWRSIDGKERVFEVEMASVVKTDPAGNPVYADPYPNLGKPLPHQTTRSP